MHRRRAVLAAALLPLALVAVGGRPASATSTAPVVVHEGVVTSQDVASRAASEPDTVVEPDVAASPVDPDIAIAAAHDSRFANGGAVAISVSRTADGGATWEHRPVPGITLATGGPYQRASDPVVAFGPDGTAYLSVLVFDNRACNSAVVVLRSGDGGRTWSAPSYADRSSSCALSDDKNWIVVDSSPTSPHVGRVYQFWSLFRYTADGQHYLGAPQVVRWSDDSARTWSELSVITPVDHGTQNSQPVVLADGTLLDTYYDFGSGMAPDAAPASPGRTPEGRVASASAVTPLFVDASGPIVASRSTDGGRTWQRAGQATSNGYGYAPGVRCCLFSGTLDPVTQTLHIAWLGGGGGNTDPVYTSSSRDGLQWTPPVRVSQGDAPGVQRVNADIVARAGTVYVSYGTRSQPQSEGGFVQQQLSTSGDGGRTFGPPLSIGPRSVLRYAAQAGGYFPGDYVGTALSGNRLYAVWARSSRPPQGSDSPYHQVIYGATLRP